MKRRKPGYFSKLVGGPLFLFRGRWLPGVVQRHLRLFFATQILAVFFGLCLLGFVVGTQTRPEPGSLPYAELFDQLQVLSYRDAPTDTSSRFVVQLCAGNKPFGQYDVDAQAFQSPPGERSYSHTITSTRYGALLVRGHVGRGFWLDVPSRRALLPEQYDELYRKTLDFVKPISRISGVLGIVSGYSVGYRLGTWNSSLSSRAMQQRVLAKPDLGPMIAHEAWRRVLLEPVVMTGEDEDVARFAAVAGTHRLYANFFRLALADSDNFIPREAARLQELGHVQEARAMLAFAGAVQHAAQDSAHLTSADFEAVERWATLLDRRGHWVQGAIPPPGEERIKLMGALAWYGLAPPGQNVDRVWVGPRMLVRVGDVEGFVSDEIPGTGVGCPISWRPRLHDENTGPTAWVSTWLADRPEFTALAALGQRVAHGLWRTRQRLADQNARTRTVPVETSPRALPGAEAVLAHRTEAISEVVEHEQRATYEFHFPSTGGDVSIRLVAADSARAAALALDAQTVVERVASINGGRTVPSGGAAESGGEVDSSTDAPLQVAMATGTAADGAADTLRARGVRDALIELPGTAVALGTSAGGEPWSPVLRDPRGRYPALARVRLAPGQAYATSSGRDRSQGLIGVAVVAADARAAARWCAVLLALDPGEARARARLNPEIAVVLIEAGTDGRETLWVETELKDRFVLDDQTQSQFRVESF